MIVLVQLVFTIGLALFLSALTVHFRDLKDLLGNLVQLWFFATPIIYPMHLAPADMRVAAEPQPDDAHHDLVSASAVLRRPARPLEAAGARWPAVDRRVPASGYFVFDRLRDQFRGRSMTPAIDVINVSKVYRRYARKKQFATLKSAILDGSLLGDLKPDETFQALRDVSFSRAEGLHLRRDRPQRLRQEHAAQVRRRHHASDRRQRQGRRPHLGADRARRRLPSRRSPAARTSSSTASCWA